MELIRKRSKRSFDQDHGNIQSPPHPPAEEGFPCGRYSRPMGRGNGQGCEGPRNNCCLPRGASNLARTKPGCVKTVAFRRGTTSTPCRISTSSQSEPSFAPESTEPLASPFQRFSALESSLSGNMGYSLRSIGFLFSLPGSSSKKISKLEVETQHLPCCDNRNYHCSAMRLSSFTEVS